jgi:hypothetical protein
MLYLFHKPVHRRCEIVVYSQVQWYEPLRSVNFVYHRHRNARCQVKRVTKVIRGSKTEGHPCSDRSNLRTSTYKLVTVVSNFFICS